VPFRFAADRPLDGEGNYLYNAAELSTTTTKMTSPLADQYISFVVRVEANTFNSSFIYDPEIIMTSLFDIGASEPTNMAWIAAIVVAGAVVVALVGIGIAMAKSKSFRRAVLPFKERREAESAIQSQHKSRTTLLDGEAELKKRDQWEMGDRRSVLMRNTIVQGSS
jgi:hypothetical protein